MKLNLWSIALSVLTLSYTVFPTFAAESPPKNVVGMDAAQNTALKKYPGTIKDKELEKERGKWIYSFDILATDGKIHEVWVDAKSGRLAGHKIETPTQEAVESQSHTDTN